MAIDFRVFDSKLAVMVDESESSNFKVFRNPIEFSSNIKRQWVAFSDIFISPTVSNPPNIGGMSIQVLPFPDPENPKRVIAEQRLSLIDNNGNPIDKNNYHMAVGYMIIAEVE